MRAEAKNGAGGGGKRAIHARRAHPSMPHPRDRLAREPATTGPCRPVLRVVRGLCGKKRERWRKGSSPESTGEQGPQALPVAGIKQLDRQLLANAIVAHAPTFRPETGRHARHLCLLEGDFRRRGQP